MPRRGRWREAKGKGYLFTERKVKGTVGGFNNDLTNMSTVNRYNTV